MVNFGNISIADLRLGASQVKALYLGSEQMWGGEEPTPTADWLCFTLDGTSFANAISLDKTGSPDPISIEYSTDGNTWSDYTWDGNTGLKIQLTNNGDKAYFRAKTENQTIGNSASNYYRFATKGLPNSLRVSGNIQTLLKADGSRTDAPAYCYYYLFYGRGDWKSTPELPATTLADYCYAYMFGSCANLTSAPELPATTLADYCYTEMFTACTSLTSAPALPATTLADHCYLQMFNGCTSLTTAPELPATTLAGGCYRAMFSGCTSLTSAPALPATTLIYACYANMFENCTSLTSAPALPATTLVYYSYNEMFKGCSSLNSVEVALTAWNYGAQTNWLDGVAASGTFTCPAELPDTRGTSNIPVGWTVAHPVVAEPLCFTAEKANSMLQLDKVGSPGAVSLEYSTDGATWSDYTWSGSTGATLTLAAVGDKVYMRAKNENQTFSTDYQNYYRFTNYVASRIAVSGNIQTLLKADGSRTDAPANCFRSLFNGCFWLTHAPNLPATTIGSSCYNGMFNTCTSLTTAPALPATTLASGCYSSMFMSCSSLSSVEVAFTEWTSGATTNWLYGVAASGTFTCPEELPDTRDASHIPTGWTKVDAA